MTPTLKDAILVKKIVREYYNNISKKYERRHLFPYPNFLSTEDKLIEEISWEVIKPSARVLDIGCGYGRRYLATLSAKDFTRIDLSEFMLKEKVEGAEHTKSIIADACSLPFRDSSFDVALLTYNTLGHIFGESMRNKLLKGINNVLKDNGIFILSVWLKGILYRILNSSECIVVTRYQDGGLLLLESIEEEKYPIYFRAFTPNEVYDMLHIDGFEEIKTYFIDYEGNVATNYREEYNYLLTIVTKECGNN